MAMQELNAEDENEVPVVACADTSSYGMKRKGARAMALHASRSALCLSSPGVGMPGLEL